MSAICQHIESAVTRWIVQSAQSNDDVANSFALATHAVGVEVVPTGLLVRPEDSRTFILSVYSGESESRITLPAIVVSCVSAQRMEDVENLYTADVEVNLEVQCDSTSGCNSVEWLDQASRWLHGILSAEDSLCRDLEAAEPGMIVSYVSNPDVGRAAEGRRRLHRWSFNVVASI